ncbi:MAG: hypothetical protein AB1750_21065, partial [Chloroflexota bacterium]
MKHTISISMITCVFLLFGCGVPPTEPPATTEGKQTVERLLDTATAANIPPTSSATEALPTPTQTPAVVFEIPTERFWLHDFFIMDETRSLAVGLKGRTEDIHPVLPVIMLTTDGGKNWAEVDAGLEIGDLNSVTFTDSVTGYAAGQDYDGRIPVILRTEDGGQTWTKATVPQTPAFVNRVYFSPAGMGWGIGFHQNGGALLLRSKDGIVWVEQGHPSPERANLRGIMFPSEDVGYAVGSGSSPYLIKTTDGGDTWIELEVPLEDGTLSDALFLDDLHGVVAGSSGDSGVILATKDGGKSWTVSKFPDSAVYLIRVFLYRAALIVVGNVCGDSTCNGLILASKDKGETWRELPRLEGRVNAIGTGNSVEGLVVFAQHTDAYASI